MVAVLFSALLLALDAPATNAPPQAQANQNEVTPKKQRKVCRVDPEDTFSKIRRRVCKVENVQPRSSESRAD